jgi:hypothetical protein
MTKNEIDLELMGAVILEITDRITLIMKLFPPREAGKEHLLRELAAASIHLSFFARDLLTDVHGKTDKEKEFLNQCGCKQYDN